ncbi:Dipeptide transport system permease protein DppB [Paraburkholderia nemoris]|uniref:ABC transporter permease n=1 Tax=Paraburkholderia nemoris TaxID=2793076 RepID=UPI001911A1D1|nr:ABC transporter permease [Paraburkholderia nemoris]MBK5153432.1 ABC transporter permease [Burkholderia sp. R-69608]CAE6965722.1 Dipeptide transport system permease protein DppB [Paraburkholderia nemoris]
MSEVTLRRRTKQSSRHTRVLSRFANVAASLLGLLTLTFVIGRVMPIDPVLSVVGPDADQALYHQVYVQLGLDKPVWVQYLHYLSDLVHGNLGRALLTGRPVIEDIVRVFPATVELATVAIVLGTLAGIPLGVAAATHRGRLTDNIIRLFSLLGYSTPIFWVGMLGLLMFYQKLGWSGGVGRVGLAFEADLKPLTGLLLLDSALEGKWAVFRSAFSHIALPACILGLHSMAYISRMTRSFMLNQLSQEYILTARVKGLSERGVIWRHAFPNIMVQLLTIVALAYGSLLEGAVLIESVFAWPGFGQYLTSSLLLGDMNAVMGCVLVVGLVFITLNLVTDALYRVFDPRTH